jgi:hypothetical protein
MKRSRFSEEQIIAILREAEGGATAKEVCQRHVARRPGHAQIQGDRSREFSVEGVVEDGPCLSR